MSYDALQYQLKDNGVAIITVERPDKLNALNEVVLNELSEVFQKVNGNQKIKGVIITGAGDKAFVAGADIKELQALDEHDGRMTSQKGQQIFQSIEDLRKPVIAAVNGYALGGGAELAMACHLRVASKKATFGLPEVGLGLIPGYGGTQRLPQIVGRGRALQMILTGEPVTAEEAHRMGLVNEISENALGRANELMERILGNAPLAVRNAIKAVFYSGSKQGFQVESDTFGRLCTTDDAYEGMAAFLAKREPNFKGE